MKLIREKVKELMFTYSDGNYNKFARDLQVDPSQLHKFLNTPKGVGGGKKLIGAVIKYSMERNLNFDDYIEL